MSHFTAVIKVVKVTDEKRDRYDKIEQAKDNAEVASVVVRADTLEDLKKKINGHVGLI